MKNAQFHLALPCEKVEKTKDFYVFVLGAKQGRSTDTWVDINLHGHQLTFVEAGSFHFDYKNYNLNGHLLPSFHFGVIVDKEVWTKIYERLLETKFEITTDATFLKNKTGEHRSFFINDPDGYTIEFKHFKYAEEMFSPDD